MNTSILELKKRRESWILTNKKRVRQLRLNINVIKAVDRGTGGTRN